jgi:hypothetical protein
VFTKARLRGLFAFVEQSNMDQDAVDDDFNAGFIADAPEPTPTPAVKDIATPEASALAAAPAAPAPKLAQITEEQYQDLLKRAGMIDEIKADTKKRIDTGFGSIGDKIGNMQQLINQLQSSTQTGQQIQVTADDFEELKAEGYPDLADMQAAGLNRILAKMKLTGTGQPGAFGADQAGEMFDARMTPQREAIKQEIREEFAHNALSNLHDDWNAVVRSPEFNAWTAANKITEKKDRTGVAFADSLDAHFIGKIIGDFKGQRKAAATQQTRLEAAVAPRGSGGHATGPTDDDEFDKGFKS